MEIPLIDWLNILIQEEKRKQSEKESHPFIQLPLPTQQQPPIIEEKPKKEEDTIIIIDI